MDEQVLIRPMTAADVPGIVEVFTAARAEMDYLPEPPTEEERSFLVSDVMAPEHEVWVAVLGGRVAGFAALSDTWLGHLYVAPAVQGRGIGSRLLDTAKRRRPDGLHLYVFQPNAGARRFYERHGFVPVAYGDGGDNDEGVPDAEYAWPGAS
jgi:ribosomal protein S18 acetylase RimI-like enzyme